MNLITFLQNNKSSRRIFGRIELKIIERQLQGIQLTQSEKNRLSRDIRPKFEFIKDCSNLQDQFKLKKNALNKQFIQKAKQLILQDKLSNDIKRIITFGSFVENTLTFRSDIDIAVVFNKINLKQATLFRKRILANTNKKIDIQVFNVLPTKIKKQILKKHRILYEKNKR